MGSPSVLQKMEARQLFVLAAADTMLCKPGLIDARQVLTQHATALDRTAKLDIHKKTDLILT